MPSSSEPITAVNPRDDESRHAERIRAVYSHYDATPAEQRKRDSANRGNAAIVLERDRRIAHALSSTFGAELATVRVLDVGCGRGGLLEWLLGRGARAENLHGIDLLEDRIADARRLHAGLDLRCADARHIPFHDGSLDLLICSTIFSSIVESDVAAAVAAEARRVLAPGGAVLWYDVRMPNPGNPNTIAMTRVRIRKLFPDLRDELRPATLLPPLARRLGPLTGALYRPLAAVPFLCSHYLGVLRRA